MNTSVLATCIRTWLALQPKTSYLTPLSLHASSREWSKTNWFLTFLLPWHSGVLFTLCVCVCVCVCVHAHVCVSRSVMSDSFVSDGSPPGSSVHGILQVIILEWVAISFFRGSSQPRTQTQVSCFAGRFFTIWATSLSWMQLVMILFTCSLEISLQHPLNMY